MSLSLTLNNALSGLNVAQNALSLTAHNIVNANTAGYARKEATPETQIVADRGAGVRTGDVKRMVDHFLIQEMRRQANAVGEAEVLERFHGRIQDFLGQPGENRDLAFRIGELQVAFEALAADPASGGLRAEILSLADGLTAQIDDFAGEIQRLRADADQEIERAVGEINGELEQIAGLNREIARLHNIDRSNPELLDRRDALVQSLGTKIDLSTFPREDGALVVQTGDGAVLVDEVARVLVYAAADQVAAGSAFGSLEIHHSSRIDPATGRPDPAARGIELISAGVRAELNAELLNDAVADAGQRITTRLQGGRIVGLLAMRDRVLPELDDQIQELAAGLRFALDAAHNAASPVPPPSSLSGSRTDLSGFAGAVRSGSATLAVIDRTDGSTLASFQVDVGAAADPAAVVAAINGGLGALGTASIGAGGGLEIRLADVAHGLALAEGDSTVEVQDAAGRTRAYGFAHYFGLNDFLVQTRGRASALAVRPDLARDPGRLGTALLDVTAAPFQAALGGPGDARGALGLADALRAGHAMIARGRLPAQTASLGGYAASLIALTSVDARHASEAAAAERSFEEALGFRAASVSGVNVDEEMARMIQLQKSYTVSARLIAVADEMFDELFRAAQ